MKTLRSLLSLSFFVLIAFMITSCKKDVEKSRLTVYLTDAPADYDAVTIEVVEIQVKATSDGGENGWQKLPMPTSPALFNVLEFTNGMDTLLSSVELPAGKISQLRLILGDNNSITVNGITGDLPLQVPSGSESGLKFNIHADLIGGVEYKLWIDFDVLRSIVVNGAGDYILKPVIRTFTEATSGAIKGVVLPAGANATVQATNGTDIFTAIPDAITGEFLIRGVPAGTWSVLLDGNNGYIDQTVPAIVVTIGQVIDIGTKTLVQ
jgi:Domain of unknown function (DUF4382)